MSRRPMVIAATCAAALVLGACGGSGGAVKGEGGVTNVTYSWTAVSPSSTQIALYAIPKALKYFDEEKLNVDTQGANGSTAALQVVASGGALATNSELVSTMAAVEKGVNVKTFGAINTQFPWKIAVPTGSSIKAPADLKGKNIGIISLASGSNLFTQSFLKQNGITPDQDVKLLPVGTGAQAKSALDSGKVQALALYSELYAQLEASGSKFRYLNNPPLFDGMPSISFTASAASFQGDKRDVLVRLGRAAYKGLLFAAVNPEAAVDIGLKVYPEIGGTGAVTPEKRNELVQQMKAWLSTATPQSGDPSSWGPWGALSDAALQKASEYAVTTGQVQQKPDISKVWDPSLIQDMNKFDKAAVIKQARAYKVN